ncbi:MAG TPA: Xaa-Pro peptidase family protein [Candidatus Eremiobacteraeota bacterium]|nr:MAG: putative peptidase [bacterium ADurb.Bin363]HPZ10314.1 Xaa-Pro peptidase family protein [Candidatus Eremiobacteraeota bacterium]
MKLTKLRNKFEEVKIDALLITSGVNRRYLSEFSGDSGWLLITGDRAILFTDFTYFERAKNEAKDFTVLQFPSSRKEKIKPLDFLSNEIKKFNIKFLGFEADNIIYSFYEDMVKKLDSVQLIPTKNLTGKLREIKKPEEIECIKKASSIADEAFKKTMEYLKPGVKESEIRAHINYFIQLFGGFKESFDIIIASGPRGAMPHAKTSDEIIKEGELIIIDYGASYNGYCSDCTRTLLIGEADEKQKYIYNLVERAQKEALSIIKPGVECKEIDKVARDIFEKEGYKEEFGHSLGHGVGLMVHEGPSVSATSDEKLEPGMVITVEPGLYFTGWGGIRIEDMIVITEQGFELITHMPHCLNKKNSKIQIF